MAQEQMRDENLKDQNLQEENVQNVKRACLLNAKEDSATLLPVPITLNANILKTTLRKKRKRKPESPAQSAEKARWRSDAVNSEYSTDALITLNVSMLSKPSQQETNVKSATHL